MARVLGFCYTAPYLQVAISLSFSLCGITKAPQNSVALKKDDYFPQVHGSSEHLFCCFSLGSFMRLGSAGGSPGLEDSRVWKLALAIAGELWVSSSWLLLLQEASLPAGLASGVGESKGGN